jgi:hypothetical protein
MDAFKAYRAVLPGSIRSTRPDCSSDDSTARFRSGLDNPKLALATSFPPNTDTLMPPANLTGPLGDSARWTVACMPPTVGGAAQATNKAAAAQQAAARMEVVARQIMLFFRFQNIVDNFVDHFGG